MIKTLIKPRGIQKSPIQAKQVLFRAQEIWWCSFAANVPVETGGSSAIERPVLVFRKFNSEVFWGLPLTTKKKDGGKFEFVFSMHQLDRTALLSQMRVLSSRRLIRRLGKISDAQLRSLNAAVTEFINETDPLRGPRVPNGKYVYGTTRKVAVN